MFGWFGSILGALQAASWQLKALIIGLVVLSGGSLSAGAAMLVLDGGSNDSPVVISTATPSPKPPIITPKPITPSPRDDSADSEEAVRTFYEGLASFDTAQMIDVSCADAVEDVETAISFLQVLIFGGEYLVGDAPDMELEDFETETVSESEDEVVVRATFRLLGGAGYGSEDFDELVVVRREGGEWCLSGDDASVEGPGSRGASTTTSSLPGILGVGDWELAIDSWEEVPARDREGWKNVIASGIATNISGRVVFTDDTLGDPISYDQVSLSMVSGDGNEYEADFGGPAIDQHGYYLGGIQRAFYPPGFGLRFGIMAQVPQIQPQYSLKVLDESGKERIISKGEVSDGRSLVPSGGISSASDACQLPGPSSAYFKGVKTLPAWAIANGNFQEQFASFDFENLGGQDLQTEYYLGGDLQLLVYLADGRVVPGSEYSYSEEAIRTEVVAPGLRKTVDINFASDALVNEGHPGLYDANGAVFALVFQRSSWCAWR